MSTTELLELDEMIEQQSQINKVYEAAIKDVQRDIMNAMQSTAVSPTVTLEHLRSAWNRLKKAECERDEILGLKAVAAIDHTDLNQDKEAA